MKRTEAVCIILFIVLRLSDCSLSKQINQFKEMSTFLHQNTLFRQKNEVMIVGVFLLNQSSFEVSDFLTDWLPNIKHGKSSGIKIMNKVPKRNTFAFTDTIVLMDSIDKAINVTLHPLLSKIKLWKKASRYYFVLAKPFEESSEALRSYVKLLWNDIGLLNFALICTDSLDRLHVLTYNPFKDEVQNFAKDEHYNMTDLFLNKLRNLYGYTINVSYWLCAPYAYKRDEKTTGLDFDFIMSFIKSINATARKMERTNYSEVSMDVHFGSADMAAVGMFLYEALLGQIGYPHGALDIVVLVETAGQVSAFTTILYIFDVYTWLFILAVSLTFYGLKWLWSNGFFSGGKKQKPDFSLKILIFAFGVFNIILTQTFQSWITTFLIYPRQAKNIDTIDELVDSKLPVYTYNYWIEFLTSKLDHQYVSGNLDYLYLVEKGQARNGGFVVTKDLAYTVSTDLGFAKEGRTFGEIYHQVQQRVGTGYMTIYLRPNSLYVSLLKDVALKSLAYGYYSKDWGGQIALIKDRRKKAKKIQPGHLQGVFLLWTVGIILSILVFIAEKFWYHYRRFPFVH